MQVNIEDIPSVPIGANGALIRIRDNNGKNLGKLWIGKGHVRWAAGNKPEKSAAKVTTKEFVEYLNKLT